jgi:excisionase family DNA binding protein
MTMTSPPPLLTIKDVAARYQVSTKTVRRWINAGDLTAAQLGNQWRICQKDLDMFIYERVKR